MDAKYNPETLHAELAAAGLKILGCAADGRIDWAADPDPAGLAAAGAVLAAHKPAAPADPLQAYRQAGINPEEMLRALWEAAGGKNGALSALRERLKGKDGAG
jgi:hypothetical protein